MLPNFQDMNQSEQDKNDLLEYSKKPLGYLLLAGTNGSGKSYAAMAIYRLNASHELPSWSPYEAMFINQSTLHEMWLNDLERGLYLDYCKNTRLLVLDDFGTRKPTEAFGDFLYMIIDYRWNQRAELGTIITTNLTAETMRIMFGNAIVSRVASGIVKRWDYEDRRCGKF